VLIVATTVEVDVAGLGEKLHVASLGSPEHAFVAKETGAVADSKPTIRFVDTLPPGCTVRDAPPAEIEKSAPLTVI
jgi:hypothetical protein